MGGGYKAPLSALPIGTTQDSAMDANMKITKVNVTRELTHSLLAVSHCTRPEDVLSANIAGFIHVTEVDVNKGILTYLSPTDK